MPTNGKITRRGFLANSAAIAAVGSLASQVNAASSVKPREALKAIAGPQPKPISNDRTIGVGFIGTGVRGRGLLGNVLNHKDVTIKAVADCNDGNRSKAIGMLEKAGVQADIYTSPTDYKQKLLARDDIDVVFVATPCYLHGPIYLDCFAAGKHFYGEKPMCIEVDEADLLVEAQKLNPKVICQIGFQRRASARYNEGIKRIREGKLGKMIAAKAGWCSGRGPIGLPRDGTRIWMGRAAQSGDWMMEQACHTWDVLCWVADGMPVAASGMGNRGVFKHMDPQRDVTDYYLANIEFPDNVLINYEHNWFVPKNDEGRWSGVYERFQSTESGIALDEGKIFWRSRKKPEQIPGPGGYAMTGESINSFLQHVREGKASVSGVVTGRMATLTGLLVRKAVYEKRRVLMSEIIKKA